LHSDIAVVLIDNHFRISRVLMSGMFIIGVVFTIGVVFLFGVGFLFGV
jgi:hypothetical protein